MEIISNYIGGMQVEPLQKQYITGINPATNEPFIQIPNSSEADVESAVKAARLAQPNWSSIPLELRYKYLIAIANEIEAQAENLSMAEATDNGKPLWLCKQVDIPRAAANFRFFATALLHFSSESHQKPTGGINYTLRQPVGIVGCISPWNLPLYLFTWKIAPALAAGNCVIAKPSEVTPYTAYLLGKICEKVGLPAGVLNIVHGTGPTCGESIVKHQAVKAISFTGSTRAGQHIASIAAPMLKKLSLELGGKNPVIIFKDCDWEKMLDVTIQSSFTNQGQICLCGSRILIEASVYNQFKADFIKRVNKLTVGDPLIDTNKLGAIVSPEHYKKILQCIEQAKADNGTILTGGYAIHLTGRCENGYFIAPTVIEGLGPNCISNQEEIFGPVVTLQPFTNEEEAISLANNSQYGLASVIWTNNISQANRVAEKIQAGIVWINCWLQRDLRTPFGGVKQSGVGREGGLEAMRFFTEPKNVCIEYE